KCGGPPVAASFSWNPGKTNSSIQDRWKQTYTEKTPEAPKVTPQPPVSTISTGQSSVKPTTTSVTPVRRFPRPLNSGNTTQLNTRISAHISAATVERTPSHTRQGSYAEALADALDSSPSSNPILDDGVALSKVYGSVLQNPETLKTYQCAD
ncbi:12994_t:CDS:2, partial [Acaulospora colombiana]